VREEFEILEAKTKTMIINEEMIENQREDYLIEYYTDMEKIH
jgi:hypothetical protein